MRELHEADFHKPGIYGSGRVWANAWDAFPSMPFRVGRGRRAAVDFVVCFRWGGLFSVFFRFFSPLTHTACCKCEANSCLIYLSTSNEARPRAANRPQPFFAFRQKSLFIPGCVQGTIISFLCRCVCTCVQHSSFLVIARAVRGRFPQTPYLWNRESMG